jgi:hypothetical protein
MSRGHASPLLAPGPFRCLVCKVYVKGTESGHCPRCGFVPPSAPPISNDRRSPTTILLLAVIAVALAAALAMYA